MAGAVFAENFGWKAEAGARQVSLALFHRP
jgi:hypothetical protein